MDQIGLTNEKIAPLVGLFSMNELKTLKLGQGKKCTFCNEECGSLSQLIGCVCPKKQKLCSQCLGQFYDQYHLNDKQTSEPILFICICKGSISDYNLV